MGSNTKASVTRKAKLVFSKVVKKCKKACRSHDNPQPSPESNSAPRPSQQHHSTTAIPIVLYANEIFSSSSIMNTHMPHCCRKWHARLAARIERKRRELADYDKTVVNAWGVIWHPLQHSVDERRAAWAAGTDTVVRDGDDDRTLVPAGEAVDIKTITHFRFDTRCLYKVHARGGLERSVLTFRTELGRRLAAEWMESRWGEEAIGRATRDWDRQYTFWLKNYKYYRGDGGPWWSGIYRPTATLLLLMLNPVFDPCVLDVWNLGSLGLLELLTGS